MVGYMFLDFGDVVRDIINNMHVQVIRHTLYLQLDNAGNQNKNRYILGFCALLVEKKVFRKVCSQ